MYHQSQFLLSSFCRAPSLSHIYRQSNRSFCVQGIKGISNDIQKMSTLLNTGGSDIIRNFAIIAHIDHGKSTLSDRLLEFSGNLKQSTVYNAQTLDTLLVEKQRGITIKARGASMFFTTSNENGYILNLIDTPGHVDFSYEVSRSLSACQAVLLLIDSSQGIQAQTIATFELAILRDLVVIPVLTKIDLQASEVDKKRKEICNMFNFNADEIILTSGKTGEGIEELVSSIIQNVPSPIGNSTAASKVLLYDSFWHSHRGVVCLVYIKDGCIRVGDTVGMYHSNRTFIIQECGILMPDLYPIDCLNTGQVGYFMANIRTPQLINVGDTIYLTENRKHVSTNNYSSINKILPIVPKSEIEPIGMVFACLYPMDSGNYSKLDDSIEKMKLEDGSVIAKQISSDALGAGFRCGFLGLLHMEVFQERLEEVSGMQVLITAPTITYRSILNTGELVFIESPEDYPRNPKLVEKFEQPMVRATIICDITHMEEVCYLCNEYSGVEESLEYIDNSYDLNMNAERVIYKYIFPFSQIVTDFYSNLKSITHGNGSLDYEECGWQKIDLVRISIVINRKSIGPLSVLCARERAHSIGKNLCQRLSKSIRRQLFEINIQAILGCTDDDYDIGSAKINGKIIAKAKVGSFGRDVLMKNGKVMGGGDESRKKKLIEAQKEGKKRMKEFGKVKVSQEAFMDVLKAK